MYFEKAGVPWIYTKERPDVHENSVYNKRPKGITTQWNDYENRITMIRANLATQESRLLKLRQDARANRTPAKSSQNLLTMYKQLNAAQTAEKYQKNVSRSKQRAA